MDDKFKDYESTITYLVKQMTQRLDKILISSQQSARLIEEQNAIKDQTIQQLTADLAERDQTIQQLTADLAELEQTIKQLTADLAEREQTIQQLMADLVKGEQDLLFYANSKSWQITRPLRKANKLAKRIFRKE